MVREFGIGNGTGRDGTGRDGNCAHPEYSWHRQILFTISVSTVLFSDCHINEICGVLEDQHPVSLKPKKKHPVSRLHPAGIGNICTRFFSPHVNLMMALQTPPHKFLDPSDSWFTSQSLACLLLEVPLSSSYTLPPASFFDSPPLLSSKVAPNRDSISPLCPKSF
ncbi:unnamed protein product [Microthlaspi erraticum]|uniref:Uncharacterized protein n=1 Tax=Microthlaspi erraticum TaxID=1685480 RepID=A0A6D2KRQ5_9BRAS|nr:unnamed protein product [Microthlaspi erraticum]CAA7056276.1 unnamed protein product [Microthlaspi erraticum]